jgi:hypothetical protein
MSYPYPYAAASPPRSRSALLLDRVVQRMPAWVAPAAVTGLIGAAVGFTLWVRPTTSPSTCLLHIFTGLDCPGCGGTRAAWYLLHGDILAAFRHHAMFVIAVPFLLYLHVSWTLRRAFRVRVPQLKISATAMLVFMLVWLVFSIARNLPWAPFTWFYV